MLKDKNFRVLYKLFFALLGLNAIITEIVTIRARGVFIPANFFSFFTIQTNLIVLIVFLLSAVMVARGESRRWVDILRAMATVYILVVGVGFAVLLSGLEGVALTAVPWDNIVLHYLIPVAVIVDFMVDRPLQKIGFKTGLLWIIYPIAYVGYSLIRGARIGWYPYPFLNPDTGLDNVTVTVLGLVVLGLLLIMLITWLTGRTR